MDQGRRSLCFVMVLVSLALQGCGGGGSEDADNPPVPAPANIYAVGGTASGLTGPLVLQNNGSDNLTISGNGPFAFGTRLPSSTSYQVSIFAAPVNQQCVIASGSGTIGTGDVRSISVNCTTPVASGPVGPGPVAPTYTIGGEVSGLNGILVLRNNAGDDRTLILNGSFAFLTPLASGSAYQVSIVSQPTNQDCVVTSGSGAVSAANVSSVSVVCTTLVTPPTFLYAVGGTVSGLSGTVILRNNSTDVLTVSNNGAFSFANKLSIPDTYQVTVLSQPVGQLCAITSGSGTIFGLDVTSVSVTCTTLVTHTLSGKISGVTGTVVLRNNGGDELSLITRGSFVFNTALLIGATYDVTAETSDANQRCVVHAGAGIMPNTEVRSIRVGCNSLRASRYVYVVSDGDDFGQGPAVSQYHIGADGQLSPLTPATIDSGSFPRSIAVHPTGKYAYVVTSEYVSGTGNIRQYTIGTDGTLSTMATASVSTPDNPRAVTVDPSGRYLYVGTYSGNGDNDIPTFAINADGSLVPLASPSGDLRHATPISLAIDPWTERLYAGSLESTSETLVQQLTILADGTLSFIVGDWVRVPSAFTKNITVDPLGRSAYLVDSTNNVVLQFARRSDNGSLSALTPASIPVLGTNAQSIALDPLGRYAYVGAAGFISQYSVDATNGALSSLTPGAVSAGEISAIATDHSGRYAYALGWGATEGKILQYTIGSDGTLTPMTATSVDTIARPVAIAVSP